jgi:hypothetical protein
LVQDFAFVLGHFVSDKTLLLVQDFAFDKTLLLVQDLLSLLSVIVLNIY